MKKSKRAGKIVMFAGVLFIAASFLLLFYNSYTEKKAGESSAQVLELLDMENVTADGEHIADYLVNPDMPMVKKEIDGREYVGTVYIESLGIALPVMAEWSAENSKIAPCVYEGTPYLDNMIIAGHNYRTHFGPISNLQAGDSVIFKDMDGNVFNYEVIGTEIIDGSDTKSMTAGAWDLTLFTCNYSGSSRITVRCIKV